MATLVYRSLPCMAPAYLAADCRSLRSADWRTCVVRQTYSNFGDRCFAVASPKLWNSLPVGIRQMDIGYEQFKRWLMTFLFGLVRSRRIVSNLLNCDLLHFLTYLCVCQMSTRSRMCSLITHQLVWRLTFSQRVKCPRHSVMKSQNLNWLTHLPYKVDLHVCLMLSVNQLTWLCG